MKVTLYTIHCPACNILEKKMQKKNISFTVIDDVNILREKGLDKFSFPLLQINNEPIMKLKEANIWVENYGGNNG